MKIMPNGGKEAREKCQTLFSTCSKLENGIFFPFKFLTPYTSYAIQTHNQTGRQAVTFTVIFRLSFRFRFVRKFNSNEMKETNMACRFFVFCVPFVCLLLSFLSWFFFLQYLLWYVYEYIIWFEMIYYTE